MTPTEHKIILITTAFLKIIKRKFRKILILIYKKKNKKNYNNMRKNFKIKYIIFFFHF